MNELLNKYLSHGLTTTIFSLIIFLLVVNMTTCSSNQVAHAYVVVKSSSKFEKVHPWRPVIRVSYYFKNGNVISELAGLVEEYKHCTISDVNNWVCQYKDGMGLNRFGFDQGKYWKEPDWGEDIRYVSRLKYNLIRCSWYRYYQGAIDGIKSCVKTYI